MTFKKRSRLIWLAAVLAIAVSACGAAEEVVSTAEEPPGSSTEPATTTTTVTADTTVPPSDTTTSTVSSTDTSQPDSEVPEEADVVVDVVMNEFAIDPGPIAVQAGVTYYFRIVNEGLIPHEFRLSNAHRIEEHLESGHDDHGEGGHHDEDGDIYVELQAGEKGSLLVTFPSDTTVYTNAACLLPGHYEAGMVTDLVYEQA
jgi:uncharacterized cupredoxin-like copper-binding protein